MHRAVTVWLDERWYNALSKHLKDETLEEHLEDVIDEMCNQLPEREYKRISALVWQERQQAKAEQGAEQHISVFQVSEDDECCQFTVSGDMDMLQIANLLNDYRRNPDLRTPAGFIAMFPRGRKFVDEEFEEYESEMMSGTGRHIRLFDIDLDNGAFVTANATDGWHQFRIRDVCSAAETAMQKTGVSWNERYTSFQNHLEGKEILEQPTLFL